MNKHTRVTNLAPCHTYPFGSRPLETALLHSASTQRNYGYASKLSKHMSTIASVRSSRMFRCGGVLAAKIMNRLTVVAVAALLSLQMVPTAYAGIYSIRILPSVTQASIGTTFDVVLQANMVVDTKATGLIKGAMTYPSTLVQLVSVTPGQYPETTITTSSGLITVSSPDKRAGNGYGGQLPILTARFKVLAGGTATFSANNGTTSGVMIVNGTNHVVVDGTVTTVGCLPGYAGTYPNCTAPAVPTTPTTVAPSTTAVTSPATAPTMAKQNTVTTPTTVTPSATSSEAPAVSSTSESDLSQTTLRAYGQIDTELDKCLSAAFGSNVYEKLVKDQSRLTYDQIAKTQQCFAERSSVVPDELAPVAPKSVKSLPVNNTVKLEKLEQVNVKKDRFIRLSGKARPNQTILIYLFSEPVVLVAKADKNGGWTYTLEDPMEPGKHEAYVTVEGTNTPAVRSEVFGFAIVAEPKTTTNPLGMSLTLQKTTSTMVYLYYIAGTVVVVALALLVILHTLRRKLARHIDSVDEHTSLPSADSTGSNPVVGGV